MPNFIGNYTRDPSSDGRFTYKGQPLYGSSGGMMYQYGRDSSGRDTFGPGTDEAGNPLGNQDQTMIGRQDPRYAAAQQAMSGHPGMAQVRFNLQGQPGGYKDPSKLIYDPTVGLITTPDNIVEMPDDTNARMLAVLAAPVAGMAMGAASGAGLGASFGDSMAAFGGAGAGAPAGAAGALPDSYWGMTADSGALGSDAAVGGAGGMSDLGGSIVGNAGNPGYAGAFDAGGVGGGIDAGGGALGGVGGGGALGGGGAGSGLAPVTDLSTQAAGSPGLLSQAGSYMANNPLGVARMGLGLASLGAGAIGSHNSSGSSGGGPTDANSIIDAMANANRVNQSTPYGSRQWSQGPDGRWMATDAYTPALQHNFDALTGLNGDVIGSARSRLAALLSAPARSRADAPISFMQHQAGG